MTLSRQLWVLLRKELLLEFRVSYAISGILLYVFATVFIVHEVFIRVPPQTWNALFWVIILFVSINAVVKSFVQESGQRQLYYYSLLDPLAVILSKIIYNVLLLLVLSFLVWGTFVFIGGNPVRAAQEFVLALFLGALGFSITFTFIAAIAAKGENSATLMAILSFPLIIPILLTLVKLSANALRLLQDSTVGNDILILAAIDLLLVALALVLFPFLWRD